MIIIFGATEMGNYLRSKFFADRNDVVYYDNDRRKWGGKYNGIEVIDFQCFLNLVRVKDVEIVIAIKNETAKFFLKDICLSDSRIFILKNDALVKFNLDKIGKFERDIEKVEENKLKRYEEAKNNFAKNGNMFAYRHAENYINFKKKNLLTPEITGIELTNHCNLKCPNCPVPISGRTKGFMDDEVFNLVLKYIPPCPCSSFSMHGLGEPLMHPKFIEYLEKVAEFDVCTVISTNGILLDKNLARETFSILRRIHKAIFYISFHTQKSVENWLDCMGFMEDIHNVDFYGQVLEHNRAQAEKWLLETGIKNPKQNPHIRYITSHSFAGNVVGRKNCYHEIEVKNRIRNCTYLKNNIVGVTWDGFLRSCCYDSENIGLCGSVFDFEAGRIHRDGFELCQNCDPDWTSNFQ